MADMIEAQAGEKDSRTNTGILKIAKKDPEIQKEFLEQYYTFLKQIVLNCHYRNGFIWAGRGRVAIHIRPEQISQVVEELTQPILEVCNDFLEKKLTPEFIENIQKTHRGEAEEGCHYSVRTTLQMMLINKLKTNRPSNLIVNFTQDNSLELYVKKQYPVGSPELKPQKQEIEEFLRRFRIMLTRLAGKGDRTMLPTPFECYCLYHNCFGTNREKVLQEYVSNAEKREELLKREKWNDETVGAVLAERYEGKRQLGNKRKISCERRTVTNRRNEYQKLLLNCIRYYMPNADSKTAKDMLEKHDMDGDIVLDFCTCFVKSAGFSKIETANLLKTRTLEKPNA